MSGSFHFLDETSSVFKQTVSKGSIEFRVAFVLTEIENIVDVFESSFSLLLCVQLFKRKRLSIVFFKFLLENVYIIIQVSVELIDIVGTFIFRLLHFLHHFYFYLISNIDREKKVEKKVEE